MSSVCRAPRETDFARFPNSAPIVIDNGASTFRIGWAGEAEPRVSFRNIVQRPRHRSSGETVTVVGDTDPALMKYFDCTRTSIRSAFDDDVVYQFEYMEYVGHSYNIIFLFFYLSARSANGFLCVFRLQMDELGSQCGLSSLHFLGICNP
uniref:Actin-related protein 5 n=1 Tax=Aegilops tauschii subsp. strangulata TaxID=200361 RepID=A0A453DXL4_AEGTS